MPKDQKKYITLDVETVENFQKCFEYIYTTLEFWKLDKTYPGNLLKDVCIDYAFTVKNLLHDFKTEEAPF